MGDCHFGQHEWNSGEVVFFIKPPTSEFSLVTGKKTFNFENVLGNSVILNNRVERIQYDHLNKVLIAADQEELTYNPGKHQSNQHLSHPISKLCTYVYRVREWYGSSNICIYQTRYLPANSVVITDNILVTRSIII